ncbi:MAG: lipid-A-disaccharide synthase [Oscillatoria princeps RMCB-10]|jgi:lipid-A-disaccharide synthase|nr:lipid-A-disaccharide synthase [Oscillatoria princeps RMCB-10]
MKGELNLTAQLRAHPPPQRRVRLFVSTGEVSGDLQGALLAEALHRQAKASGMELEIVGLGGERMAKAGCTLLGNTSGTGSVGILESLPYVWPTLQQQRRAKQYLRENPPDLLVLIDYIGPNLAIGSYVKRQMPQVPVVYYIAPQMWVWSPSPGYAARLVAAIDRLLAIFPEEASYFRERGASVTWVGHPLLDWLQSFPSREEARRALGIDGETLAVALLPASRQQELKYLLPVMFEAARQLQEQLPQVRFWIPVSLERFRGAVEEAIERYGLRAIAVFGQSQEVLAAADLAIAKSGTVNLEIALLNVPQVVVYRVNPLTYWLARRVLNFSIPFMSPPNLVQMQPIVPELLQERATPAAILGESLDLLLNAGRRQETLTNYQQMRLKLGEVGVCDRAAKEIFQLLV